MDRSLIWTNLKYKKIFKTTSKQPKRENPSKTQAGIGHDK